MLRKMCTKHRLLPTSYATTEELKKAEDIPRTGGGSADVWYGVYQGSRVAIKVLRVNSGVDLRTVEMVRIPTLFVLLCVNLLRADEN